MSKQTEALKLALEALLGWGKGFPDNWGDLDTEAVTAIREALALVNEVDQEQPAQRTWVGLTDEEISKIPSWIYSPDQDGMTAQEGLEIFARAIEAKLREKNT